MNSKVIFKDSLAKKRNEFKQQSSSKLVGTSKPLTRRSSSNAVLNSGKSLETLRPKLGASISNMSTLNGAFLPQATRAQRTSRPNSARVQSAKTYSTESLDPVEDNTFLITGLTPNSKVAPVNRRQSEDVINNRMEFISTLKIQQVSASVGNIAEEKPLKPLESKKDSKNSVNESLEEFASINASTSVVPRAPESQISNMSVEEEFSSTFDLAFDVKDMEGSKTFTVLPYQVFYYNKVLLASQLQVYPHPEETSEGMPEISGYPHLMHEMFMLDIPTLDFNRFKVTVMGCIDEISILRSRLHRNDKILDADVEGYTDPSSKINIDTLITCLNSEEEPIQSVTELAFLVKKFIHLRNPHINPAVRFVYATGKSTADGPVKTYFLILASCANFDQHTLSCISRLVLDRYFDPTIYRPLNGFNDYNFADSISISKTQNKVKAFEYWKAQCFEAFEHKVSDSQKAEMENQILKLNAEHDRFKEQIAIMKGKRSEMERELLDLKQKRLDLEKNSTGPKTSFVDPVSYELITIPNSVRGHIMNIVFGNPSGDIFDYLDQNGIDAEFRRRIGSPITSVEDFCALTENKLLFLSPIERKRVTILSENVRNRIKDALHDLLSLKYNLERRISKLERELKHLLTNLHNTQKQFDTGDDLRIRIGQSLNPPIISNKIFPLKIEKNNFDVEADGYHQQYESLCFTIDQEVLSNLRQFQDFLSTLEGQGLLERSTSFDDDNQVPTITSPSVNAVCLAAFGIIMRHITGTEKFLIGVKQDFRRPDSILGPYSDTFPIKIDAGEKSGTLNSMVLQIWTALKNAAENGVSCPSQMIMENLGYADLPVCFEFVENSRIQSYEKMGVTVEDLLFKRDVKDSVQRLWSVDESAPFDLKLKILDMKSELHCSFTYRRDMYSSEKVFRWAEKFENTLWQIEYGARKLTIHHIISRLYNRVWQGSSQSLVSSLADLSTMEAK